MGEPNWPTHTNTHTHFHSHPHTITHTQTSTATLPRLIARDSVSSRSSVCSCYAGSVYAAFLVRVCMMMMMMWSLYVASSSVWPPLTDRFRRTAPCWTTCSRGLRESRSVPWTAACAGCSTQPDLAAVRGAAHRAECMADGEAWQKWVFCK